MSLLRQGLRKNQLRCATLSNSKYHKLKKYQSALTSTKKPTEKDEISNSPKPKPSNQAQDYQSQEHKHKKTIAELDEDMRLKLEGISGEGGIAGVEYEGGKAVGLKRGVKDNMFRVI